MDKSNRLELPFPRPLSGAVVKRPPSALVPARISLEGQVVQLIPQYAPRDAQELFAASHGSEAASRIWDYLPYGPWPDLTAYEETLRQQSASFDPIFYTIKSIATGKACGQASYLDIHPRNGVIEIGHIWFAPELQRTRGATEALYLLLCYAMDELAYRRMQWRCNSLNEKSRQAARRLGFRFEGIFYNHLIFKGKNRDTAWYSILDDEWPEVKEIIGQWLDPSNFDREGNSKSSLWDMMQKRSESTRKIG